MPDGPHSVTMAGGGVIASILAVLVWIGVLVASILRRGGKKKTETEAPPEDPRQASS